MKKDKDSLRVADYLAHILQAIARIERYCEDMADWAFLENELVQDGVVRNIEVIGEAVKNIERCNPAFIEQHPHVPWTVIYAMRNRVAHGYFKIDFSLIWHTVENDLPRLKQQIQELVMRLQNYP
ncbi:Conserved hypothetical protein [Candidatus Glomeribacter gigasporarum BEG34]|uniref:DUF86 domain-containing protein n=1 Tax=Candidatus Glomeribacter gigasporarum BEG34 TaxID=1070319 RepID=G2J8P1_9BURK|nr:DUF86 domain-containing protein [Candidatus Glomeribacter gigasporarum]CCD29138.1 Conserved hypothetical protein [Candidatus Glomeribacter gigasporarum BEG34]